MPRPPRIQFNGAFYHVYHRGNRQEPIFLTDSDYATFERFLIEAMNRSGVRLFDWSILPNHFHLLVETPDGNLAEFMQRLTTRYAMYFNWKYQKVGHVFQGRYGARLCDKERYFMELVRYVELNAYRTTAPLATLGDWKWSSLRYYNMPKSQWPEGCQIAFTQVLERFGTDGETARKNMAKFLADGLEKGDWEDFYNAKNGPLFEHEKPVEQPTVKQEQAPAVANREPKPFQRFSDFARWATEKLNIDLEAVRSVTQGRAVSRWRQALVAVGRSQYRFPVSDMASYVNRDGTAVSQILRRLNGRSSPLEEIQKLMELLARS